MKKNGNGSIFAPVRKLLIFHYLRIYLRILSSCLKTFGFGMWFFYFLLKIPMKVLYVHVSMFLDNIFFPGWRRVKIENPVFVIGHPRSATTFLHEILTSADDFLVFKDWEMNHPSLTMRALLKRSKTMRLLASLVSDLRFSPYRIRQQIKRRKDEAGMGKVVEDYKENQELTAHEEELLFLHVLDSQFLTLETPLGFVKHGYPELCYHDEKPHQEKSVRFFKDCFKRQLYCTGKKQIMAKMNFSLFRIRTLLKVFPDAKIIHLVRSPLQTMPSHFSLHRRLLDRQFGLDNIGADKLDQYFEHRYNYNVLFYKYFDEIIKNNVIPQEQIMEITYDSIKKDFQGAMRQIKEFANLEFSPELEEKLKAQDQQQSSYKRKHKNLPLEAFNVTEEQIRDDLAFVFEQYGFK